MRSLQQCPRQLVLTFCGECTCSPVEDVSLFVGEGCEGGLGRVDVEVGHSGRVVFYPRRCRKGVGSTVGLYRRMVLIESAKGKAMRDLAEGSRNKSGSYTRRSDSGVKHPCEYVQQGGDSPSRDEWLKGSCVFWL